MDNHCIICLETSDDTFSRITTLSSEWIDGKMQRIIEKHLWWWYLNPSSPKKEILPWICCQCWQEISSFHSFYCKVEKAHRNFQTILKSLQQNNSAKDIIGTCNIKQEMENGDESTIKEHDRVRTRKKPRTVENIEIKSEFYFNPVEDNGQQEDLIYIDNESFCLDALDIQHLNNYNEDWDKLESDKDDKSFTNRVRKVKCREKTKRKTKLVPGGKKLQKNLKESKVGPKDNTNSEEGKSDNFFEDSGHKMECCICNVRLPDFRALKVHFRNEHNTKGYAMCCGKKYFKRCLLVDHLRVHKDPNFFKCPECEKIFATRRGLEMHVEIHKSRERKFNCGECGKSYFKLNVFERHKLSHVPQSERQFICSQCEKKFASDYLRRQHEDLTHTKKYDKICDICGKSFRHKYSFLRHMEEHAGTMPALETCKICDAKLTDKYGLRHHMKMRHVEENMKQQICPYCSRVSPNLNAHRMHIKYTHTMQRKHACHLCDKAFRRPLELKEHLSTHTGEALYTCPHCPRTFISNANMHKHRKIAHRQEWEETRLKNLHEKGRKNVRISYIINGLSETQNSPENLVVFETHSSVDASVLNI